MTRRYRPCDFVRVASTTMVLFILLETTCPITTLRRPDSLVVVACCVSAIYFFSVSAPATWRSRAIVLMRAMSLRSPRIFFRLSDCPILSWNFRRKSWSLSSRSWCWSSASVKLRTLSAFILGSFLPSGDFLMCSCRSRCRCSMSRDKCRAQGQLVRGEPHGFRSLLRRHTFHFKQDLAGTNYRDPMVGRAFAFSHTGFGRLLRDRLVGEEADPDFPTALDETRHSNTAGFDLPVGDPARLEHLQPIITVSQLRASPRLARHAPALLLPVLHFFWHQHRSVLSCQFSVSEPVGSCGLGLAFLLRQNFAAVNPALHADHAVRGLRLGETVINVRPQRVQGQTSLQVPLGARDFVAVQAPANAHLDSLATEAQRGIYGLAHGATKAHALFKLQRDRFGYQLRIKFRLVHFLDVDVHLARRALLQLLLQLVDFRTLTPDDDAGTRRADDDAQLVAGTLHFDGADARRLQLVLQFFLQLDVFEQQLVLVTLDKPTRLPRLGVAEPESVWMDLLSHCCSCKSSTSISP